MSPHRRTPAEERLFNLILALLATTQGLTKSEILSTVQGYAERFEYGGDNASLARQFERDKDGIRSLGVPLETVDDPSAPDNNQLQRYRIPQTAYELPADVQFTAAEITLLELASRVWRSGSLSDDSRRALLKLRSLGDTDLDALVGLAPRVTTRHRAFGPLNDALTQRVTVEFDYVRPSSRHARRRRVAPLTLVQHESRWHLCGFDYGVEAVRTFLLERIVGSVAVTRDAIEPWVFEQHGEEADAAADQLREIWASNVAVITVAHDTDAAVKLRRRAAEPAEEPDRLRVHFTDRDTFADQLTSYGPDVTVHSPESLRDAVVERLRGLAETHRGERA